jgi:hypothetical protein
MISWLISFHSFRNMWIPRGISNGSCLGPGLMINWLISFHSFRNMGIPQAISSGSCFGAKAKVIWRTVPRNNSSRCLFHILYIFAATRFGPCWPSSGAIHNYSRKVPHSQRIRCFVLLGLAYCTCLANTAVVFLICVCELSKRGQITSLLNVKTLKC